MGRYPGDVLHRAVDGDVDFIGAKTYVTKTTSLVVPDPLIVGARTMRVIAAKTAGIVSQPSATSSFSVQPLATHPDLPGQQRRLQVQDVVLDWAPVTGAKTYDVQVATDQAFTKIVDNATGITRHAVRAGDQPPQQRVLVAGARHDLLGQGHPVDHFAEPLPPNYPQRAPPLYPLGTDGTPAAVASDDPYLGWTPVKQASLYEIKMADDENLSTDVRSCTTALTSYTTFPELEVNGVPRAASTPVRTGGGCGLSTTRAITGTISVRPNCRPGLYLECAGGGRRSYPALRFAPVAGTAIGSAPTGSTRTAGVPPRPAATTALLSSTGTSSSTPSGIGC